MKLSKKIHNELFLLSSLLGLTGGAPRTVRSQSNKLSQGVPLNSSDLGNVRFNAPQFDCEILENWPVYCFFCLCEVLSSLQRALQCQSDTEESKSQ